MGMTHLEIRDTFPNFLHLASAFETQDERSLWRRIDGALADHEVLEVEPTVIRDAYRLSLVKPGPMATKVDCSTAKENK